MDESENSSVQLLVPSVFTLAVFLRLLSCFVLNVPNDEFAERKGTPGKKLVELKLKSRRSKNRQCEHGISW